MSVVMADPTQIDASEWRLTWTGTGPTYYIWRDSSFLTTTTKLFYDVHIDPGEVATFDVFEDSSTTPDYNQPCRGIIWWYATTSTKEYRVEVYSGGSWSTAITIPDTGRAVYNYTTDVLANETTHQYRVYSVGLDGNDSSALTFSILAVRRPNPPTYTYAWTKLTTTLTLTIS